MLMKPPIFFWPQTNTKMKTMKTPTNRHLKSSLGIGTIIAKFAACAALLAATNLAFGQLNQGTPKTWTGAAGDYIFGTGNNWNTGTAPSSGSGDIAIWDTNGLTGNIEGNVLQVTNRSSNSSNPGMTLYVTSNHVNGFSIIATGSGNPLRLGTNSLVIDSGSGPVSLGNSGPNAFQVALVLGSGNNNYFTNNSSHTATINSDVYWVMGSGNNHNIALCGSGDWNLFNQWSPQNAGSGGAASQLIINGTGTVVYAPTNASGVTWPSAQAFIGITVNSGTFKLGNGFCLTNLSGPLTLNGGTFDINGFSITNNLNGGANIDTTAEGATPVLTVSNANNSTFSGVIKNTAGTLSLVKLGPGSLALGGANTYSGDTAVNVGSLFVNGSIASGTVTVASGATLGGTGVIAGSVNLLTGASATFSVTNNGTGNGTPLTVLGSATLNSNSVTIFVPGSTPLPGGTYVLMTAAGGISSNFVGNLGPVNFTGAGLASGLGVSITCAGSVATMSVTNLGIGGTWITDLAGGSGNWSASANWSSNPKVPSVPGDVATLGVGSALSLVALDTDVSVGGINFTNPSSFAITDAGKKITFDDLGTGVGIYVSAGTSNSVATAVSLNDKTLINVASGTSLSVSGIISGTGPANTLTKNGNGTLILSGNNAYGPAAGANGTMWSGGVLELGGANALSSGDLTNSANGTLRFDAPMTVANKLWINSASTVTLDDNNNPITLTGGLGGTGSIVKVGTNTDTFAFTGANTVGNLGINIGVLKIASGTINASVSGGGTYVDNGATLIVDTNAVLNCSSSSAYYGIGNTTNTTSTNIINGTFNWPFNAVVARLGGGNLTINSGVFSCNSFFDGQATTDIGTVMLNGGTLLVTNVQSSGGLVNPFYFNGGTLAAKGPNSGFWANSAGIAAYVLDNPGTIDNRGYAITIAQPINSFSGTDGGMIFKGTGVTTMSAATLGYTGPTVVNAGTVIMNSAMQAGNINVNGGTLQINGQTLGGDITVASGGAFGGTGTINAVNTGVTWESGASAWLSVSNNAGANATPLSINGDVTLNNNNVTINVPGSTPLPVGTYTLIQNAWSYTGSFAPTPTFTGAGLAGGTAGTISSDGVNVYLTVGVAGNTWTHDGNGSWSTPANWSGNPAIPSVPGDFAVFGVGAALTTVTLDTNVAIGGITFTNPNSFVVTGSGKTVTLTNGAVSPSLNAFGGQSNLITVPVVLNGTVVTYGAAGSAVGISGTVAGTGGFGLRGNGVLNLSGSNTYSGATILTSGTLSFGSTNAISTNTLTINGGYLDSSVSNLLNAKNNAQIWTASFGYIGTGNLNLGTGSVTATNAALTITVTTNKLAIGGNINAGGNTLTLAGTNGMLELDGSNTITGTLNSGVKVLVVGSDYATGTGTLNANAPNAAFASSSSATRTIRNVLGTANGGYGWDTTGAGNLIFTGGVVSYNVAKTCTINNPVTTWNFALPNGAASTTKLGTGTLVLAGANANTGGNIVTEGTLALANSSALGTGTLIMNGGNLDSLTANLININNNPQTWNTNFTYLGSQSLNLGNGAVTMTTNVVITVVNNALEVDGAISDGGAGYFLSLPGAGAFVLGGSGTLDGGSYAGPLTNNGTFTYSSSEPQTLSGDISGTGALVKGGASVLTLSGTNTYTGNTTVQGGILEVVNAVLATNSTISVSNGAALQLDFAVTNPVAKLVLNGALQPTGVYGAGNSGGLITGSGFLQVLTVSPTGPASITSSVSGSAMNLSWPAGQGWCLQMQTNSLAKGLGTNWIYLTDGGISSTNITVDPAMPTVFYRLTYP